MLVQLNFKRLTLSGWFWSRSMNPSNPDPANWFLKFFLVILKGNTCIRNEKCLVYTVSTEQELVLPLAGSVSSALWGSSVGPAHPPAWPADHLRSSYQSPHSPTGREGGRVRVTQLSNTATDHGSDGQAGGWRSRKEYWALQKQPYKESLFQTDGFWLTLRGPGQESHCCLHQDPL